MKKQSSNKNRILILLVFSILFLSVFVSADVTIQDYGPSFFIYDYHSSRLLIEHFETIESIENNGGTISGTLSLEPGWIYNSANFSGTQNINYGNNFDFTTNDFTIEFWFKPNSENTNQYIVAKKNHGTFGGYAVIYNEDSNTGKITFIGTEANGSNLLWELSSDSELNDGEWHHIALVRDYSDTTNGIKIYVDGLLDNQGSQTQGSVTNNLDFRISSDSAGNNNFIGLLDELVITNSAKSDNEIKANPFIYPSYNQTINYSIINLNWSTAYDLDEDTINYDLLIADNTDFNEPIINETGLSDLNFTTQTLEDGIYYWVLRPINDIVGGFTKITKFVVDNILPVITWVNPNNYFNYVPIFRPETEGIEQEIIFTDDFLNMYNCTIYDNNGNIVWTVQKSIYGNTTYTEDSTINTVGWHGYYTQNCTVSDI